MKVTTQEINNPEYLLLKRFARDLRPKDGEELAMFNILDVEAIVRALTVHILSSERAIIAYFNEAPAVMAGVIKKEGKTPSLWLMTTNVVDCHKKTYVKWLKGMDIKMRQWYPHVVCEANRDYVGAVRLLEAMDFQRNTANKFCQFTRKV